MQLKTVVLLAGWAGLAVGHPSISLLPEESELFEGDIILPQYHSRAIRNLVSSSSMLWPGGILPYEFKGGEFSGLQKARIIEAMSDLQTVTCVRFEPRTRQATFVIFRNVGRGCASPVGYHPIGQGIDVYLGGPACQTRGTIQHELLHSLGFWHEHTRPDRDKHITILWHNIIKGREFNFLARNTSEVRYLGMPYDYGSVMHYRSIAFSKDRRTPTIITADSSAMLRIGQRIRFSQVDLAKLNRLYNCPINYYHGDDIQGRLAIIGELQVDAEELERYVLPSMTDEDEILPNPQRTTHNSVPVLMSSEIENHVRKNKETKTNINALSDTLILNIMARPYNIHFNETKVKQVA